jgi:hypothetical protein
MAYDGKSEQFGKKLLLVNVTTRLLSSAASALLT